MRRRYVILFGLSVFSDPPVVGQAFRTIFAKCYCDSLPPLISQAPMRCRLVIRLLRGTGKLQLPVKEPVS